MSNTEAYVRLVLYIGCGYVYVTTCWDAMKTINEFDRYYEEKDKKAKEEKEKKEEEDNQRTTIGLSISSSLLLINHNSVCNPYHRSSSLSYYYVRSSNLTLVYVLLN